MKNREMSQQRRGRKMPDKMTSPYRRKRRMVSNGCKIIVILSKYQKTKIRRKRWEKFNGFYDDRTGNLYCSEKSCFDCRRMFNPDIDIPMMCGQMLVDGIKDAEVYSDTTCKHFFGYGRKEADD
jgi:hypothetical protein